jgi:hypothetical protein
VNEINSFCKVGFNEISYIIYLRTIISRNLNGFKRYGECILPWASSSGSSRLTPFSYIPISESVKEAR